MSLLSTSAVRARVAALVGTIPDWRESPIVYDLFPADPGRFAHLAFAVGVPRTDFPGVESSYSRRSATQGARVQTVVGVRWTSRLRADNHVADYDAALDGESSLLRNVVEIDRTGLHLAVVSVSRRVVGDGTWFLGELNVSATHAYELVSA